jgi:membrane-bound lytic murein transglycosylase D
MRTFSQCHILAKVAVASACILESGCALSSTARPQQYRSFFLPPSPSAPVPVYQPMIDAPALSTVAFVNEAPNFGSSLVVIPRSTDTDFILRRAEDRFAAGKKAIQDGRYDQARAEFDKAVEILLSAPDDTSERPKLEKRLQEMVDAIYRYDAGELGASEPAAEAAAGRPIDDLVEMTFPVDPSLRNKVREQIQATTSQLPLEENDAVVSYINYFSSPRGRKSLELGLRRSGRYKSMIERVLAEEGLPQELIFLAQAESGFMPLALSTKECVGVWQFAKFRGEEYGLQVTPALDERRDPEKATRAAAKHLHDLYTHLGDWYLAMAAYDCGPGCIDQRVARTGYADFWTLRRLNVLPKETANYVPAILAMIIVSKNAKDYGLEDLDLDSPLEYDTEELESPTSLALAANALDRPIADLKELNPALLKPIAPAGYQLRIPKGTLDILEQAFAAIPPSERDSWRLHRVETGDTAASLAKRYGTTPELVESANRGELPEAGELAAIPVAYPGDRPPPAKRTTTIAKPAAVAQKVLAAKSAALAKNAAPAAAKSSLAVAASTHAPNAVRVSAVSRTPASTASSEKKPTVAQAAKKLPVRKPAAAPHTPGA